MLCSVLIPICALFTKHIGQTILNLNYSPTGSEESTITASYLPSGARLRNSIAGKNGWEEY